MPDIRQMGSCGTLFDPPEIQTPERRGHIQIADTSKTSWQRKHGKLGSEYLLILAYLIDHGPSVHDAMVAAGVVCQASSGRMGELVAKGLIEVIGTGKTRTGNPAKLCQITDAGRQAVRDGMLPTPANRRQA